MGPFATTAAAGLLSLLLQTRLTEAATMRSLPSFTSFVDLFSRGYPPGSSEFEKRREVFEKRAEEARRHNSKAGRRWTAGVNDLWDWTDAELDRLNGWRGARKQRSDGASVVSGGASVATVSLEQHGGEVKSLPKAVSWDQLNSTKKVWKQGRCGSCWAIASAALLQAHSEIHFGDRGRTFSAQEMVSCVPNPDQCGGSGGCEGSTVELALDWVLKKGLSDESEAPYLASDAPCASKAADAGSSMLQGGKDFGMEGWTKLPENRLEPLMRALVESGPVAVSVGARGWHTYAEGIFDQCSKDAVINHAVLAIGYGEADTGDKFWTILNSWGRDWGEDGKMRLLRKDSDETEYCGIDSEPEVGTGCRGGPSEVQVCGMCGILYDAALPVFRSKKRAASFLQSF